MEGFKEKMAILEGFIAEKSNVQVGVDVEFALSNGLEIKNDEKSSQEINLFEQSSNSKIALAFIEA